MLQYRKRVGRDRGRMLFCRRREEVVIYREGEGRRLGYREHRKEGRVSRLLVLISHVTL